MVLIDMCSRNRQLPLLSMDQTELQRRLEDKVAEMLAPPAKSNPTRMCRKTSFQASSVMRQYMTHDEADCDLSSKVGKICFYVLCNRNCCALHTDKSSAQMRFFHIRLS